MVHRLLLVARAGAALLGLCAALASAEVAGTAVDAPVADAAPAEAVVPPAAGEVEWLDPWLTDAGPVLPEPAPAPAAARGQDQIVLAWQAAPATPHARTAALRRLRLELGLGDLTAPAQVVRGSADPDEPETGTALALELAPDMPALGWARVGDLWRAGAYGEAARALGELVFAIGHDLESQVWLIGNGLIFAWIVALASAMAFIAMLALKAFPHAAHDLGDPLSNGMPAFARAALLAALGLIPLALGEGIAGLVLACFAVAFVYGTGRERSALVLAAIAFVVALHPLARWAATASTILESDPVVRSAWAVTRGTADRADLERLEAAATDDVVAAHALAHLARRLGEPDEAARRLEAMVAAHPTDPVVLANRANVEMRAGRTGDAIRLYERAAAQLDSPALLFDLSQAYASALRMDESELALARAQRIADAQVAALSSLSDPKLVADLGYPVSMLRDRLREAALAPAPVPASTQQLAPGRIGEDWQMAGAAFGVVVLLGIATAGRFERSSDCARCGRRVCARCDGNVWSDELCDDCHHLFKNPDATDPKLRMARLQVLARREAWRTRLVDLGSVLVPGVAALAARRPDAALLSIALCVWLVAWLRWPAGPLVDSSWLGGIAPAFTSLLAGLALAAHAVIVVGSFIVRRNR
ncbi:MAG: BTAD domain-containing putative transcriptional regulator [Myxococcota bacterium]